MPKPAKTHPKQKIKQKPKAEPQTPSVTTKKSYWISLIAMLTVVTAVFGAIMGFSMARTAVVIVMVAVVIGFVGLLRTGKSDLSLSKRATFIFGGASIIGFIIWAAITLSGSMAQVAIAVGEEFYVLTSLPTCLAAGAFIGELLGRNKKIQQRLFFDMKN